MASFQRCFEGRRDEAIGGIDRFVSAVSQVHVVARPFDPHPPLRANLAIPLLEAGECCECEVNRRRRDGADQPPGDRLVEWRGRDAQAGARRQGFAVFPDALIDRIDATVSGIAYPQTAPAGAAEKHALQQAESLSRRTGQHLAIRPVAGEAKPVGLVPVPVDVAFVMITYHHSPGVLGDRTRASGDLAGWPHLLRGLILDPAVEPCGTPPNRRIA
jgi:hypothetical protein